MTYDELTRRLARVGVPAAWALAVLTAAWVVTMALVPRLGAEVPAPERLAWLVDHRAAQLLAFVFVLPLGLVHVPVWLALGAVGLKTRPAAAVLAVAFGLVYAPFTIFSYWVQVTVVPGLPALGARNPEAAVVALELLGFHDAPWSLTGSVDVLGYAVWGVAALCLAVALWETPRARAVCALFGASALFALIGAVGFVARVPVLQFGVLLSGALFLPAIVAGALHLRGVARG